MSSVRRLLTALVIVLCASFAHAQAYTSIVVIGDSLSDTGNDTHLSSATYGPAAAVPAPVTGYTNGRFTDGIDTTPPASLYKGVWIEQLANLLAAKPTVTNSLDGGTNYAYGFAFTGTGTTPFTYGPGNALSFPVNNMGLQLSTYLATKPTITSKTLFVVWGGANDILNATSSAAIGTAATNEIGIIQSLITAGATDIIIPNLPPLGAIPRANGTPATAAALTSAAAGFNQALAAGIAALPAANAGKTLHLFQLDVFGLFSSVITTPSAYNFTNVTASSQFAAVNPDTYLFWDGLHPTTAGHHQLATTALALIAPTSSTTTLTSSSLAANLGTSITFTAKVAATGGTPTGVVTFYDGGTALGNAQLSAAGTATFTTTSLTAGTHNISATYTATQYFNASNSNTLAEVITAPAIVPTVTPVGLSIASGSTGTANISVATVGGFSGTVNLSCGNLPSTLSCSFSPSSLVFAGANNTLTSTLTVSTGGPRISRLSPGTVGSFHLQTIAACSLLPLFGFVTLRRRKGTRGIMLLALLLLLSFGAVTGLSGCGSDVTTGANPGSYAVPVIFNSASSSATVSFQVTVTK